MIIPGDWHAGLAMLQSIYTLFWTGFLEPIKEGLGWKRISKDVRGCYYQACCLANFVLHELLRVLMFECCCDREEYTTESNADDFITDFTSDFQRFLLTAAKGNDEWRKVCALFVLMMIDFTNFVNAYRSGDAIMIEQGYIQFSMVWQMFGQTKYVERTWHQLETCYSDHPYSRLHELRMNRCVRRYKSSLGKRMMAQDEAVELWNRFFTEFPKVKTLLSWVLQGNYVGLAFRCRTFVDMFLSSVTKDKPPVHKHGVEPVMIPEMQFIFQVLIKSSTHLVDDERIFNGQFISDFITDDMKSQLKRTKLESQMKQSDATHSYNLIFSLVEQMYAEQNLGSSSNDNSDSESGDVVLGVACDGDVDENLHQNVYEIEDEMLEGVRNNEDTNEEEEADASSDNVDCSKGVHPLVSMNLWITGDNFFLSLDIKQVRAIAKTRINKKRRVHRELVKKVAEMRKQRNLVVIGQEKLIPTQPWR